MPAVILKIFRKKKSAVMFSVWKNKSYRYFLYLNVNDILEKKNCTCFVSHSTRVFQCQTFFFSIVRKWSHFWFLKFEGFFVLVGFIYKKRHFHSFLELRTRTILSTKKKSVCFLSKKGFSPSRFCTFIKVKKKTEQDVYFHLDWWACFWSQLYSLNRTVHFSF